MKKTFLAVFAATALAASATASATVTTSAVGSVYFCLNGGAERAVVHEVWAAKQRIFVQAYSFTSPPIYKALAEAKGAVLMFVP